MYLTLATAVEWMFLVQKNVMKVEVPMKKAETLMSLTRYAAYSGTRFMNPFKVSRKVILHFAQRQPNVNLVLTFEEAKAYVQ